MARRWQRRSTDNRSREVVTNHGWGKLTFDVAADAGYDQAWYLMTASGITAVEA